MNNNEYIDMCNKSPKDIINYVIDDMVKILAHTELDENIKDKIGEWWYILQKVNKQIEN